MEMASLTITPRVLLADIFASYTRDLCSAGLEVLVPKGEHASTSRCNNDSTERKLTLPPSL